MTATVQADFVCVEKVHAEAHLSTGGMGILGGGRDETREREKEPLSEREKWRRLVQRMRRGEDRSSWCPRTQRGSVRRVKGASTVHKFFLEERDYF